MLVCAALAACSGSLCAQHFGLSGGYELLIGAALCLFAVAFISKRISAVSVLLGIALIFCAWTGIRGRQPAELSEGKFDVSARICAEPIEQTEAGRTVLTLDNVRIGGDEFEYKLRVYMYDAQVSYEYGQQLSIEGLKLSRPSVQMNEGGFDFRAYLWRGGVAVCGSSQDESITIEESPVSLTRTLYRIKRTLADGFDKVFLEQSDVMRALLLGDRTQLSEETYEDFTNCGIAHIIALSGLHVSCLALLFEWLMKHLGIGAFIRKVLTLVLLALYAVMTGASASTVRAVLMYAMGSAAMLSGYPSDTFTRLAFAFLVQMTVNPLRLNDNGFVLSYAAVLGIICTGDIARSLLSVSGNGETSFKTGITDAGTTSLAVQTVTFPLCAGMFYSVPLLSVPVNMLCVPFALITLYAGAAAAVLMFISIPVTRVLMLPVRLIWQGIKWVTARVAELTLATLSAREWPLWVVIAFFTMVLIMSPYLAKRIRVRRGMFGTLFVIIVLMLLRPSGISNGLRVTFLNVGYGDGALVEAQGQAFVVDCGKNNGIVADYITAHGYKLSGIFVSHPDSDHAGGLNELLKRNAYARVYLPECWDSMEVPEDMQAALSGRKIEYLYAGETLKLTRDVDVLVTWPDELEIPKSDNDGSLVIRLEYADASVLFAGDITDACDVQAGVPADILKVAHHGSKYASTKAFLETVKPEVAVISVESNSYGHPTEEVLGRLEDVGAAVFRTDECGAITVDFNKDGSYDITTFLNAEAAS